MRPLAREDINTGPEGNEEEAVIVIIIIIIIIIITIMITMTITTTPPGLKSHCLHSLSTKENYPDDGFN